MTHLGKIAAQRDSECRCCRTNVSRSDRTKARRAQRRRERQDFRRAAHAEALENQT